MFNRHGRGFALSAGHIGVHRDFTFFTGWDAVNHRGKEFRPIAVDIFPGYSLGIELGSVADLALFTFDRPIEGVADLNFAPSPLTFGESLTHGGFGRLGVWNQEEFAQDGVARAGIAYQIGASLGSGANPDTYFALTLSISDPDSSRGRVGSSGNPGQREVDNTLLTYGMVTQGSLGLFGRTTQFVRLDLENAPVHGFINERTAYRAGVPEPSSALLLGLSALSMYGSIRRRQPKTE